MGGRRVPIFCSAACAAGPGSALCRWAGRPRQPRSARLERDMNYFKTAIRLAGMTALFMGVGYLIGGQTGALIALAAAAAMNFFAYWNSDRMVLSMHGAQEIDERAAPDLFRLVRELSQRAGL